MNIIEQYTDFPQQIINKINYANVFLQKSVFDYYKSIGKNVIYFYDEERVLPLVISKKIKFTYGYFPTEPWIYSENHTVGQEIVFLDEIVNECKESLHLDWIGQTPPSALFSDAPSKSINIPFGSHIIDLTLSEEELWNKVHSKHRNVIRKAEKSDIKVTSGGIELLPEYLIAEKDTMERSNLTVGTESTYSTCFKEFGNNVRIFLAKQADTIQGGAIIVYNEAMAYYMHGASINSPVTGAMNLVQWEIIKYLKCQNVKKYSFVGARINEDENSKYHGIQNFKKRFGGELFEGTMFKVIYSPFKFWLYKRLLWLKTKGIGSKDIIDQEIHKWK